MPVEPRIAMMLKQMNSHPLPSLEDLKPEDLRKGTGNAAFTFGVEEVKRVEDRKLPLKGRDISVRIYTPEGQGPWPASFFSTGAALWSEIWNRMTPSAGTWRTRFMPG